MQMNLQKEVERQEIGNSQEVVSNLGGGTFSIGSGNIMAEYNLKMDIISVF